MINKDLLVKQANKYSILLDENQIEKLETYAQFLVEYNEKVNLTAIIDADEIVIKHFIDSLLLSKLIDFTKPVSLVDVGTGAGFPGMVLKIVFPEIKLTLMDSLNKRINFLEQLGEKLLLKNVIYQHIRAEDAGKNMEFREKFDYATARAVAALPVLCEYCLPLVKPGGYFVAMKGSNVSEEIEGSKNAIKLLSSELQEIKTFSLTGKDDRSFVLVKKISHCSTKYPRKATNIKKYPL